jgi:hypothetical protein
VLAELKEQPGKDLAVGGAGLASTVMNLGLIDEYRLFACGHVDVETCGSTVRSSACSTTRHAVYYHF